MILSWLLWCWIVLLSRVDKREKRVSIPACKSSFWSTKYTCICLVLQLDKVLSQLLHKSMSGDLCTSKTGIRQLDTLFSSLLCTLVITCFWSEINNYSTHHEEQEVCNCLGIIYQGKGVEIHTNTLVLTHCHHWKKLIVCGISTKSVT